MSTSWVYNGVLPLDFSLLHTCTYTFNDRYTIDTYVFLRSARTLSHMISWKCLLRYSHWNGSYIILGLVDQHLGNWYKNATYVSSVTMYVGMVDIHILFPWPCQILFDSYDYHAASQSFYMSQIVNYPFHQTLCFVHFFFGILVSLNNDPTMIINMDSYFWNKFNIHNHT